MAGSLPNTATVSATNVSGSVSAMATITFGTTSACPTTTACLAAPINEAIASGVSFAIFGLANSNLQLSSGPLAITGALGIGANGQFHLSGGSTQPGPLYADGTAHVQIDGGSSISGGVITQSMAAAQTAAINLSATDAALPPTQTFSQITNPMTITGNGGLNVIDVTGTFQLSGGNFVISGGPSDTFIFNLQSGMQLSGNTNIVLSGVSPIQVLFNFPGTSGQLQTSGNSDTAGIFLAPLLPQTQINGGVHNSEFIAGGNFSFQSNPQVTAPVCTH